MPALIVKAVGFNKGQSETKGAQVTFLSEKGNKADIEHPVRYSGSSDAIIMLQKPAQKDHRWFLAADIETALQVAKLKPDGRVACLANPEKSERNPLKDDHNKELIFCFKDKAEQLIDKVVKVFYEKLFKIMVASLSDNKLVINSNIHSKNKNFHDKTQLKNHQKDQEHEL